MKRFIWLVPLFILILIPVGSAGAERVHWAGYVPGNGSRIGPIGLRAGNSYVIEVSGWMYFGRWSQNGRSLYYDSCFEFNARNRPVPMTVLKNNLNVIYCSGYRSSHVYRSAPFRSNGKSLSLWVYDTDYRDNKGGFSVVVLETSSGGGGGGQPGVSPSPGHNHNRSIKLFNKITRRDSKAFKANKMTSLRMDTRKWDKTPYRMTRPYHSSVTIPRGARVYLSSRPNSRAAVYIDNFFLFTYRSSAGSGSFTVGGHEPVYFNNRRLRQVGPNNHSQNIELTKYLPQGAALDLRVYALDYGGVGGISDVYLLIK